MFGFFISFLNKYYGFVFLFLVFDISKGGGLSTSVAGSSGGAGVGLEKRA